MRRKTNVVIFNKVGWGSNRITFNPIGILLPWCYPPPMVTLLIDEDVLEEDGSLSIEIILFHDEVICLWDERIHTDGP